MVANSNPTDKSNGDNTYTDIDTEDSSSVEYAGDEEVDIVDDGDEEVQGRMTREDLLRALRNGVMSGVLTKEQAAQIRRDNFIFNSEFTKSPRDEAKEKRKRKAQKKARKITRRAGQKGISNNKGKRIRVNK